MKRALSSQRITFSEPLKIRNSVSQIWKFSAWSTKRGFRFSGKKITLVVFRKRFSRISPLPPLFLQNFQINFQSFYKFLGLIFEYNTTWTSHIKILRSECLRYLNILTYLSHPRTGCDCKLLLRLYNSVIRSQLDYGAPIYSKTCKASLKLLIYPISCCERRPLCPEYESHSQSMCRGRQISSWIPLLNC